MEKIMNYDYIVVGSGFAGSVISERIASKLDKKVLLLEKREHIGGNCYDYENSNGIIVHKYGPHLFHTNNSEVIEYLSKFTTWREYYHEVLAYVDGIKIPIPFNFNTLEKVFDKDKALSLEQKLSTMFEKDSKVSILQLLKVEDEELSSLAEFIYEKIFLNYTLKQWGLQVEELDPEIFSRVPVFIGRDNRYFNDSYQCIPSSGYTKVFEKIIDHKNIDLRCNTRLNDVFKIKEDEFYLFDKKFEGKVIYTGKIDELFNYKFGELPYRTLDMKFETIDKEFFQEKTTVNYPNDYDFTRITEFKHIHPCKTEKTTILKEYPKEYDKNKDIPYYPIFTKENKIKYEQYLSYSERYENLIFLGRLAEYKYYDMDDIVQKALDLFKELK